MGHDYQKAAEDLDAEIKRDRVFATKLGRKSNYGVGALVAMEVAGERCPCGAAQIAGEAQVPEAFVEHILGRLRRAGFVESRRGRGGGFRGFDRRAPEELLRPEALGGALAVIWAVLFCVLLIFSGRVRLAHPNPRGARAVPDLARDRAYAFAVGAPSVGVRRTRTFRNDRGPRLATGTIC